MEPIIWVAFGLVAGWLAGLLMKGGGYGLVGTVLVAIAGAVVFVGLARLLTRRVVHA